MHALSWTESVNVVFDNCLIHLVGGSFGISHGQSASLFLDEVLYEATEPIWIALDCAVCV